MALWSARDPDEGTHHIVDVEEDRLVGHHGHPAGRAAGPPPPPRPPPRPAARARSPECRPGSVNVILDFFFSRQMRCRPGVVVVLCCCCLFVDPASALSRPLPPSPKAEPRRRTDEPPRLGPRKEPSCYKKYRQRTLEREEPCSGGRVRTGPAREHLPER